MVPRRNEKSQMKEGSDFSGKPFPDGSSNGCGAAVHTKFLEEVAGVGVGGMDADAEAVGNFLGGQAFDDQSQHVAFAGRQRDGR